MSKQRLQTEINLKYMIALSSQEDGSRAFHQHHGETNNLASVKGDVHHENADDSVKTSFKARALKFLIGAACVVSVSVLAPSALNRSNEEPVSSSTLSGVGNHVDWKTHQPLKFHQSGFGTLNFNHHEDGASKFRRYLESTDVVIPKNQNPEAIPSIWEHNIINLHGHYVHDEHRSPFSSFLYKRPKEELLKEQEEFKKKMEEVRREWGAWGFRDHLNGVRPVQNFDTVKHRDVKSDQWQGNVWQKDVKYVNDLIAEGRKLVDRMTEAIYAEVGYPTKKADGTMMSAEEIESRETLLTVHVLEDSEYKIKLDGVSYLSARAFDALARKLLHGMITNDDFYFVLGGHSAAAGHGNNLHQQKTMQFNYIMEPVFHKLGMRLMARNLAMGGYGTSHYTAGQAELYGEADFLMWDSMMTEKAREGHEMFNRQAILTGERAPIIFTRVPHDLLTETGGKAWLGDVVAGVASIPETTSVEEGRTMPWAIQYLQCAAGVDLCGGRGFEKYNTVCFIERNDYDGTHLKMENVKPKGQASWHPGWRDHQFESRKVALTFLKAFKKAFDVWEEGMKVDGFPLKESYWHVGSIYEDIQKTLHDYVNGEGKGKSRCEEAFEPYGVEKWCRTGMHGMTEFTPVNGGFANSIIEHAKKGANGYPKVVGGKMPYAGPELLPLNWKIPEGDVDVHAIAIATDYDVPQLEFLWEDEDNDEEVDNSRRRLRQMTDNGLNSMKLQQTERVLSSTGIVPGEGWGTSENAVMQRTDEFCDGSAMSECNRAPGDTRCLLYANNDRRGGLTGDGESGWLVIDVPEVKEGIIFAKIEWWHPRSGNWKIPEDVDRNHRELGGYVKPLPDDFKFDIAVNGKIETWDLEKFMSHTKEVAYNEAFYPLVNDETLSGPVELAIRMRSESDPKGAAITLNHIYWG